MAEVEAAAGTAQAHNPTVLVGLSSAELEAELKRRAEQYEAEAPARLVAGLEASLAKNEAIVAHLKEKLAEAKAAAKEGNK